MAVTEPSTGTTRRAQEHGREQGDRYIVNGQKVWISRHSALGFDDLLARTSRLRKSRKRPTACRHSSSICMSDRARMTVQPIQNMVTMRPTSSSSITSKFGRELIGEEGRGFATSSTA